MSRKPLSPRASRLIKATRRSQQWLMDNGYLKKGKRYKWIPSKKGERILRVAE